MTFRTTVRLEGAIVAETSDDGIALQAVKSAIDSVINKNGASESQYVEASVNFGFLIFEFIRLPVGRAKGTHVAEAGVDV